MNRGVCFSLMWALFSPHWAWAQMQPHRAEYSLRLGAAANAPRIGTAVQDITLDCTRWYIKRDVSSEIAVTSSWKLSLASRLTAEEQRDGKTFHYHVVQIENGAERETQGQVQRTEREARAEIASPNGLAHLIFPPAILMPITAMNHLIDWQRTKAGTFTAQIFEAEAAVDAFQVSVKGLDPDALRAAPRVANPVLVPATQFWPVFMTFTRGGRQNPRPLFSISAKVFDSGVLDRLTIDAGVAIVTADLQALEMHEMPSCPGL